MRVILRKEVPGTGKQNEVVDVAEGYARNYLLPKGLAVEATAGNLRDLTHKKEKQAQREAKELAEAEKTAAALKDVAVTIAVKAGEAGRLFGSIGTRDIGISLTEKTGLEIDRRKIVWEGPIKELGIYEVPLKLHPQITAIIKVEVVEAEEERG
jgi:large subunit ribosomal protein L9